MIDDQQIRKLASKLDQEDFAVLGGLLQKVAADSVKAGAQAVSTREAEIHKMASDLVSQGYTDEEIVGAVEKVAQHQKVATECEGISQDIMAMGTMLGKQASAVQLQHADELATYIGKEAAKVCIAELQGYVKSAEEPCPHEDEDKDKDKDKKDESGKSALPPQFVSKTDEGKDKEDESEKEATDRRVELLKTILAGSGLESAAA